MLEFFNAKAEYNGNKLVKHKMTSKIREIFTRIFISLYHRYTIIYTTINSLLGYNNFLYTFKYKKKRKEIFSKHTLIKFHLRDGTIVRVCDQFTLLAGTASITRLHGIYDCFPRFMINE